MELDKGMQLLLLREKRLRLARSSFWEYCKLLHPTFYKESRQYLKDMCNTLQLFYEDKLINPNTNEPYLNMTINIPPRHGKSFTIQNFSTWIYGVNLQQQIITVSYSRDLSDRFSQNVRDAINVEEGRDFKITYADIFPNIIIKSGDGGKRAWSLEGASRLNYYATSFGSVITGLGTSLGILDDPIKDSTEAFNDRILEEKLFWYDNTFASRIEKGGKRILIQTRWSIKDLTGRLLSRESDEWYEMKLPACLDEETQEMLCDELFDFKMYSKLKSTQDESIFLANYQQEPIEVRGRLYQNLLTYELDELPQFEKIINYTDTADKGADYLCSIVAGVKDKQIYILDVLYTQDDMSITESKVAKMLLQNRVNKSTIESNNGGQGYARSVERILNDELKSRFTEIETFHQSNNKESRILSMSSYVQRNVFFPINWGKRWEDFAIAINTYQRSFKDNKHDDAPDCLTGLCEQVEDGGSKQWKAVPSLY